MSTKLGLGAVALFVFFLPNPQTATAQSAAAKGLASAKSLSCIFRINATGTWNNDGPRAEVKTSNVTVRFEQIDLDEGSAQVVGMPGPSYAVARMTGGALHLMTIDNDGPLYVTTVFEDEALARKLKAVHTRHAYTRVSLPGFTSRPEQYYGECELE